MAVYTDNGTNTPNGSHLEFTYTFPTIKTDGTDVKVALNGQTQATNKYTVTTTSPTKITFNNTSPDSTLQESTGAPKTGVTVRVYRDTYVDAAEAVYAAGSSIRAADLNNNQDQVLYALQEEQQLQIVSEDISTGAINSTHIKDGTIVAADIADDTITATQIAANAVTTSELLNSAVTTAKIADGHVSRAKIANGAIAADQLDSNAVTNAKMADDSVGTSELINSAVTTAKIADGNVSRAKIAADAIDGTKLADNAIDSEHYTDGSIDTAHIANLAVGASQIANNACTELKLADNSVGTRQYIDGSIDHVHLAADIIDGDNIQDDVINSEHIAAGAVDLEHMSANSVDSDQYVDGSIDRIHLEADIIDSTKLADNAVGTEHIADAELTTLAGMQSGTASVLAGSTALTSTLAELNMLDGKSIVTSISGSSTDVQLPTAKAVDDRVTALVTDVGGFRPIANETSFPATNPDPDDDAGTIVSVKALASNLTSNGSGVATIANGAGTGNTVTINGMANSDTIEAGKGILVETTSTLHTYTFHRETLAPADITAAKTAVDDFNDRYRVNAGEPSDSLHEGDLVYDTNADKMKVYDTTTSAWKEVTSTGDFKYLFLCPAGGTGAPTINGSIATYDLREGSNSGSAASVTNAAQLLVSINGVVQKANTGTSAPAEGFAMVDANTIIFSENLPSGASVFIHQAGSAVTIPTPGDDTVSTAKIQNLAVTTGKIADQAVTLAKLPHGDGSSNGKYLRSNNGADPTWETISQYSTPLTTRGDILYRDASGDQRLAKGTAGQYLKIGANDPEWADVVGAVADGCIFENDQTISNNYTIASGKGAHSVGPITVNATVTVNGNWVVS